MAQIREIKRRIKSINNTSKVTHAMELVAAAKMRKSQEKTLASRPYTITLNEVISQLRFASHEKRHQLLTSNQNGKPLIIIVTSDRGLVGGLNLNIFRETAKLDYKNAKFITIGKKALTFAAKTGSEVLASFYSDEQPYLDLARTLTKLVTGSFTTLEISSVYAIYPDFISTIKQIPTIIKILPIEFDADHQPSSINPLRQVEDEASHQLSTILFEPSADTILEHILPHYVLTRFYQILLEAKASEHSARMVAMKNATDAASDLVDELTLTYNQARQEAITKELLDIVTAQSAFQ